jgi:predicted amidohydrolase YtcJ
MNTFARTLCILSTVLLAAQAPEPARGAVPVADANAVTLIRGARIYAFDAAGTVHPKGAIAIGGGRIVDIGDDVALVAEYPEAKHIDLDGATVLPGLIDSHGHLFGLALSYTQADLTGTASRVEVLERLRAFAGRLPPGAWLLGRGWDQNDWPDPVFPDRAELDAAFPDRPVWLRRIDGHAGWANSAALAQADRDLGGGWQEPGGHIYRNADGRPTGILVDKAMDYVDRAVPAPDDGLLDSALDLATAEMIRLGLTAVHDPGVGLDVLRRYQRKIAAGEFPVRVYAMADGVGDTLDWLCANGPLEDPSGRLVMRSVKLYADGALGSRGAALLADYSDDAGNSGLLFLTDAELEAQLARVFSCGLQAGVHAIGDRANRQVLDAYAKLIPRFPDNPGRHRIEHAQILDPADIPRFAALGVIAAMQPTHATSDMYWADERLGEKRLAGAYAWRSLLDSGARLAFGSDFPVEKVDPMLGIHAAVTRQDSSGQPPGGWLPAERIGRAEAIRAFTRDAAWAGFMEDEIGSLEPGKRADFIVLDRDIMQVPDPELLDVRVRQTWVGGARVYPR